MSDSDEDLMSNSVLRHQHETAGSNRTFNGRSGSPMSMRSIDSNASAADIALALKTAKFNVNDLRLIKKAYHRLMKSHARKRIEKRRNLKIFSKGYRQRLGEDSGEQGSDSSISSDDCRSSRTILNKDNMLKSINKPLTTNDLTQFRTSMKENDLYKDCTENLKQNHLRNMFTVNSLKHTTNSTPEEKDENTSVVTLKKRFAKGASFQWPCQRFNKSKVISNETSATNVLTEIPRNINNLHTETESTKAFDTDSEKEEIFSQSTVKANTAHQRTMRQKRVLEDEESNSSNRKRSKTAISPIKENYSLSNNINIQNNDFNFRKPKIPIRKISNVFTYKKDSVPEILIAKSRLPLTGNLELDLPNNNNNNKSEQNNNFNDEQNSVGQNKELLQKTAEVIEPDCFNHTEVSQNSTDVSMRPSFLKRKLFTQKFDISESKNISSDNLATNSPQTKIYNPCREKNKVRKIVSSQSCLSRDVLGDDNVLDLIHKIVPPDQMNMTNATNKKVLSKNNIDNNDKRDVASVISMCNSDEGSNNYTDEEIFKVPQISKKNSTKQVNKEVDKPTAEKNKMTEVKKPQPTVNNTIKLNTDCKVVVNKMETNACSSKNDAAKSQCTNKRTVSNGLKSFWDTDYESDTEERTVQVKQDNGVYKDDSKSSSNTNLSKRNFIKGTILTVRSFQRNGLNSSMRSDISRMMTNANNKKVLSKNNIDNNDKWDVASVISMCNIDEGSNTYTDEEIFIVPQISKKNNTKQVNKEVDKPTAEKNKMTEVKKPQPTVNNTIKLNTDCKVVVNKMETNVCSSKNDAAKSECTNKRTVSNGLKSFWDTDYESDTEERTVQVKQDNGVHKDDSKSSSNTNLSKRNFIKGTILTVRSFQRNGLNSSTRSDISRVSKQTDYDITRQQKNNKTPNKNTKSSQNDEKKTQEQVVQSSKPQINSGSKRNLSKVTNEKPKSNPVPTKEIESNKQKSKENSECNTSRQSLRLKQKKEQTEMKSTTQINKRGRPAKGSIEKNNDSINKNSQTGNKKSKETSNKDVKSLKNPTIKIGNLNKTRQTPRKCTKKMQLSTSVDSSSLNTSNILSTSLRVRRKNVKCLV